MRSRQSQAQLAFRGGRHPTVLPTWQKVTDMGLTFTGMEGVPSPSAPTDVMVDHPRGSRYYLGTIRRYGLRDPDIGTSYT